jgi:hypothetical protein
MRFFAYEGMSFMCMPYFSFIIELGVSTNAQDWVPVNSEIHLFILGIGLRVG